MAETSKRQQLDSLSTTLTAATSLLTGIGAALGSATGALNRAARDQPLLLAVGFFLLIAAGLMSVFTLPGVWPIYWKSWLRHNLLSASPVLFAAGIVISVLTLVYTPTHPPQPLAITGGVSSTANGETLNITIKGGGLSTSDRVQVEIQASGTSTPWIYQATVGVDATGGVDDPITLALPRGTYQQARVFAWVGPPRSAPVNKCDELGSRASCAFFEIRPAVTHPQLVTSWTGSGESQAVTATVVANNLNPDQAVGVMVIGTTVARPTATPSPDPILYASLFQPDDQGAAKGTITIPVGTKYAELCVVAEVAGPTTSWPPALDGKCPPTTAGQVAWAHLTAP